jgi:hypothetical protein
MQDSNAQRPGGPSDSDATSKETLENLDKSEQDSGAKDASDDSRLPAPDGVDDAVPDKPDDAGPM